MRRHAVVLALLLASIACPAAPAASPHIVGGTVASLVYPGQAQVGVATGPSTSTICGGTLVAPAWVLTAAHCVSADGTGAQADAAAVTVRLGSTQLYGGTVHAVDVVERSPDWNPGSLTSDVALVHLVKPSALAPVAFASATELAAGRAGAPARVLGWGQTAVRSGASPVLREADVPVVADGVCGSRSVYGQAFDATTMLCAGGGGADACYGDSGGPLLVDADPSAVLSWRVIGVVSWGDGCGTEGRPGVYADLAEPRVRAWIAGTVAGTPVVLPDAAAGDDDTTATVDTPVAGTPVADTPAATPAAGSIALPRACSRTRCRVALHFPAAGLAELRLTLPRSAVARRAVTLVRKRVVTRVAGARAVTLRLPPAMRRAMRRARVARLRVRLDATLYVAGAPVVSARRTATVRR